MSEKTHRIIIFGWALIAIGLLLFMFAKQFANLFANNNEPRYQADVYDLRDSKVSFRMCKYSDKEKPEICISLLDYKELRKYLDDVTSKVCISSN